METAKEVADLIQLSIEDDVADITVATGHEAKAWIDVITGGRTYRVVIVQLEGAHDEYTDAPEEDLMDAMYEDA